MKLAVIKTGGKQYVVAEKTKLKVEKLPVEVGQMVDFPVLLMAEDEAVKLGQPEVSGAKVSAKVLAQGRTKKITAVKYKAKSRYRRQINHRQSYTEILVEKIA